MIWDECPEGFSADDVASAANAASGLETDRGMLTQLATRLKAAGEQSGPDGATSGLLLIADGLACDLWLCREDLHGRRGRDDPASRSIDRAFLGQPA
jgi:hypothetical protein